MQIKCNKYHTLNFKKFIYLWKALSDRNITILFKKLFNYLNGSKNVPLASHSIIFRSVGDVIIPTNGLHNRPWAGGILVSWHTYCDTGPPFCGFIRRTFPFNCRFMTIMNCQGPILSRITTGYETRTFWCASNVCLVLWLLYDFCTAQMPKDHKIFQKFKGSL